jgi:hypothetical protein
MPFWSVRANPPVPSTRRAVSAASRVELASVRMMAQSTGATSSTCVVARTGIWRSPVIPPDRVDVLLPHIDELTSKPARARSPP